jgi:hypothetical protein
LMSAMLNFFGLFLRACKTAHARTHTHAHTHGRCQQCGTSSACSCAACPPHPTTPCAPHETASHPVPVCLVCACARACGRGSARRATRRARGQHAADGVFSSSTANSAQRVDHGCRLHHTVRHPAGMMALSAPFALKTQALPQMADSYLRFKYSNIHSCQNKSFIRSIASTLPSVYTILPCRAVPLHNAARCTLHAALPASVLSRWSRPVLKSWPAFRAKKGGPR